MTSVMICGEIIDVGDRYEVKLPCLLWKGHEGYHEAGNASSGAMRALSKWQERVDKAEVALEEGLQALRQCRVRGTAPDPRVIRKIEEVLGVR